MLLGNLGCVPAAVSLHPPHQQPMHGFKMLQVLCAAQHLCDDTCIADAVKPSCHCMNQTAMSFLQGIEHTSASCRCLQILYSAAAKAVMQHTAPLQLLEASCSRYAYSQTPLVSASSLCRSRTVFVLLPCCQQVGLQGCATSSSAAEAATGYVLTCGR